MARARPFAAALISLTAAALLAAACQSGSAATSPRPAAGGGAGGASSSGFGHSACGECVTAACAKSIQACHGDPTCATHSSCVDACGTTEQGGVDPSCVAACPGAQGSAAQKLIDDYTQCREDAAGQCAACGSDAGGGAPNLGGGSNAGGNTNAAGMGGASGAGGASDTSAAKQLLNQVCSPSSETSACFKCEDERCCDTYAACAGDAKCQAYKECMKACPSDYKTCVAQCDQEAPGGFEPFTTRLACVNERCLAECGGTPVDPCVSCVNDHCSLEDVTCQLNEDCARLSLCVQDCDSGTCFDDCYALYPKGKRDFQMLGDCSLVSCERVCG